MKAARLNALVSSLNRMSRRDRMALLAGGAALLAGLEFQLVWPLHERAAALSGQSQSTDPLQQQTAQTELDQKRAELARLQPKAQAASAQTTVSPQVAFAALRQTLSLQHVEVVSLRALPEEEPLEVAAPASQASPVAEGDAVPAPAEAASAAVPEAPPAPAPALYRHRAELKLSGPLASVMAVLRDLERSGQPLSLERVRLAGVTRDPSAIEATVMLVTINGERTWLAL